MKAMLAISSLAVLLATPVKAQTEADLERELVEINQLDLDFKNWRNNTHHMLIECSGFYGYTYLRLRNEPDPKVKEGAREAAKLSVDLETRARALGLDERVTQARVKMFVDDIKRNYSYDGAFSVLIAKYQYTCPEQINASTREMAEYTQKFKKFTSKTPTRNQH